MSYDYINPDHYKKGSKEVYEMMIDIWGKDAFIKHCEMCAFKYRMRLGEKPDQPIVVNVPKYKVQNEVIHKEQREHKNTTVASIGIPEYNIIPDVSDNNFAPLIKQVIEMDQSFQIDGMGGVGKSHFCRELMEALKAADKKLIILGPTHMSCRVLGEEAHTINSFFNKWNSKGFDKLNNFDYILIDEKSMVRELFFKLFVHIKMNTSVKFILAGDFGQLEAVCDRAEFDYEHSSAVHFLSDGNMVQLTKCRRADEEHFNLCKQLRDGKDIDINDFGKEECYRSVSFRNSKRKAVNKKWMEHFAEDLDHVHIAANKHDDKSQDMYLYVGLPVVACKTNSKYDFVNSEQFKVCSFDGTNVSLGFPFAGPKLKPNEGQIFVPVDVFTKSFYPAYCTTIHKAQGATIQEAYTIYEWDELTPKLKYVAVSRATTKANVNIFH